MEDNDELNTDDMDMFNSNDMSPTKLTSYINSDGNGNSPNGNSKDSFDDTFMTGDEDTRTPGEILDEFCMKLEDINTTLPDSVINHYMKKAGFIVNDPKLVKIVSIASQKFISEIVNDVMQHHKLKSKNAAAIPTQSQTAAAKNKTAAGGAPGTSSTNSAGATSSHAGNAASANASANATAPLTLTLEDLSQVLTEYGINVKKPYYFM